MSRKSKWTLKRCKEEAKKYKNRVDFRLKSRGAYDYARKNKIMDKVCAHMEHKVKTPNYWSVEKCTKEAKKYKTISEFQKKAQGAYLASKRLKIFDEITKHMSSSQKSKNYWNKSRCKEVAKNFESRTEFSKKEKGAYLAARRNNWLDEICKHMSYREVKNRKWTKEKCQEEALKYNTRAEFQKKSGSAVNAARKLGVMDEICTHMEQLVKPAGYWTLEKCREEALKFKTRKKFFDGSPAAYTQAHKRGFLDEVCKHMKTQGSKRLRFVYVYEFEDGSAYVGLTYNFDKRKRQHELRDDSAVFHHMKKGYKYKFVCDEELYDFNLAGAKEEELINRYKEDGWNLLNRQKAGSLGGTTIKWTKEKVLQEAKKYDSRSKFKSESSGAYNAAKRLKILSLACSHMESRQKPSGYWTKERCAAEALNYTNKRDFAKGSAGAYDSAIKNNYIDAICEHMDELKKPNGYWTKKRCAEEAKKYKTRSEFAKNSGPAYLVAQRSKWLDQITGHMKSARKPAGYWNKERCQMEAKKYKTRTEFQKSSGSAYAAARKLDIIDLICEHME